MSDEVELSIFGIMKTQVNIKKPCFENWETMKIGLHSRFCENCQKNVVDFTNKNRKEILEYLLSNYDKKVCGRVYPSQLDFTHSDFIVTINALIEQRKKSNLPFYLLSIGTVLLTSCNNDVSTINTTSHSDTISISDSAIKTNTVSPTKTVIEDVLLGEVTAFDDTVYVKEGTEPYNFVDVMPEFKGGFDSLIYFIRKNLEYPDWEKENKIQGRVIAKFVIDKNGKIKDIKIVTTVEGSKNFDTEVLRVINNMPDWIPGQLNGKNVDVQFNLPISFKL